MNMPLKRPSIQPRSRLAHEAAKWAGKQFRFDEYNLAIFSAFFEHGKDIGDIEILKKIAVDLKLDEESLHISLENGEFTEIVLADENEARQVGVKAIPAFVANGKVQAAGVQTAKRLYELLSS